MKLSDCMDYAPRKIDKPAVKPGEFVFSAAHLNHGHINGMCRGLMDAGATLKYVYDPDPEKVRAFLKAFPEAIPAENERQILDDRDTQLVAGAAITSERCDLGLRVIGAGKDYFTDKAPLTTLEQLEKAQKATRETGRKYMCYYAERLHVESAIFAGYLIGQGAIGRVLHVAGFGPHRLGAGSRPAWFFDKSKYGGILIDIGSHQIEQYLYFAGESDARVVSSRVANYAHPEYPDMDDFGDCTITGKNGTTNYFRVDWFTPDGLRTWGDGRTFIVGEKGSIEIRKYIDICTDEGRANQVLLIDSEGEKRFDVNGKIGYPFFPALILDCLNRTENAMTQEHCFLAARLAAEAQMNACL